MKPLTWASLDEALANPMTGEAATGARSALASTDQDAPLVFVRRLAPDNPGSPRHRLHRIHESFLVTEGQLLMTVGASRRERRPASGDRIDIRPRTRHEFRSAPSSVMAVRMPRDLGALQEAGA